MLRSQAVLLHRKLIGEPHSESEILLRDDLVICWLKRWKIYKIGVFRDTLICTVPIIGFKLVWPSLMFYYSSVFWVNIFYLA